MVDIHGRFMTQERWVTLGPATCSVQGMATWLLGSGVRVSGWATQVLRAHSELDTERIIHQNLS